MSVNKLDCFITESLKLLETDASKTRVAMKYKPSQDGSSRVSFYTSNSSLGMKYSYKTKQSKNVSRALSALGPTGVNLPLGHVGKRVHKKKSLDLRGMATLMVNQKVKRHVDAETQKKKPAAAVKGAAAAAVGIQKGNRKSQKKGKK